MNIEEIKKDTKNTQSIQISKNAIICGLSIALVLVSAVAIGLAVDGVEHHDRGDHNRGRTQQNSEEQGMYDESNSIKLPVTNTPTTTTVTTQVAPKQ